jgi:geranylgeranylglycerol-phosphate geranylgeranyltransferase
MRNEIKGILSLTRPVNSLMVGFAVIVGITVSDPSKLIQLSTLFGFLTGFLISSFSMIINDYYDLEVDKVNEPKRPLSSGTVKPRTALLFAILILAMGISSSLFISFNNFLLASLFAGVAWFYNNRGKKMTLIGNMLVALSISIPYLYGGLVVESSIKPIILWMTLVTFFAATGREVVKTISDISGDEIRKVRSVALVYGGSTAALFGSGMFVLAIVLSWFPFILKIVGLIYIALIMIPNIVLIYASIRIIREPSRHNAIHVKKIALLGMFMGLVAFLLGGSIRI